MRPSLWSASLSEIKGRLMRTVCIVQARVGSKRLPGKVLLPLNGHTVIGEVLSRCRKIPGIDEVVLAVPDTKENEPLARLAGQGLSVHCGSEHDVLDRYCTAALGRANVVMRITADCPLISPELCGAVLSKLLGERADYASNIEPRTFPQGLDCEVFTWDLLDRAFKYRPDEHVTTWMRIAPGVKRVYVTNPWTIEGRLTLDTEDDYRTICAYFGHKPYETSRRLSAA
jgi:spore coat polysaccharide biosynthesis protein SpsF (cytidylyltransferase family)